MNRGETTMILGPQNSVRWHLEIFLSLIDKGKHSTISTNITKKIFIKAWINIWNVIALIIVSNGLFTYAVHYIFFIIQTDWNIVQYFFSLRSRMEKLFNYSCFMFNLFLYEQIYLKRTVYYNIISFRLYAMRYACVLRTCIARRRLYVSTKIDRKFKKCTVASLTKCFPLRPNFDHQLIHKYFLLRACSCIC